MRLSPMMIPTKASRPKRRYDVADGNNPDEKKKVCVER